MKITKKPRKDFYEYFNVDKTKLSRDYIIEPLKFYNIGSKRYRERPNINDIKYLYVELGIPNKDLREYFRSETIIKYINNELHLTKSQQQRKQNQQRTMGVSNPSQLPDFADKARKTFMKNYGVDWVSKSKQIQNKKDNTKIVKYGDKHYNNSEKRYNTKRKLKEELGFDSKMEYKLYQILLQYFDKEDILIHYKDKERYPYNCDFYIKSKDLFIELYGYWTHGFNYKRQFVGLFDEYNHEHIKLLEFWKKQSINHPVEKIREDYKTAIYTWTKLDVLKKKYVENNHLNMIIIIPDDIKKNKILNKIKEYIDN